MNTGNKIFKQGDGATITAADGGDAAGEIIIFDDVIPSSVDNDAKKICIGQMMLTDYGEVGRVVGVDPNGILEVNDSENSVSKGAGDASTSMHVYHFTC
jgi:hypothetical protein